MPASQLSQPLTELPQIGAQRGSRFASLGLRTIRDVLFFFPRDFEFPPPQVRIDELVDGQTASILGTISDAELVSRRPGRSVFGALVENESGAIRILFFNQPFRAEQLKRGTIVRISGSVKLNGLRFEMTHPKVQIEQDHPQASDDADDQPTAGSRIAPIYPLTEGVKQFELQRLTADVTRLYAKELDEVMPVTLRTDAMTCLMQAEVFDELDASELPSQLPTIDTALSMLHDPQTNSHVQLGRIRFVFQELLAMQLALAMRRRSLTTALRAPPLECSALIRQRIVRRFPFALTSDQERVIDAIAGDMRRQFPMNRLLQGDVGSGKTVVAAFAMLLAVANGYQATMMAPTEVLARQHFQTLSDLLQDSRVRVGLLCGSLTTAERRETLQRSADGELDLIVGTQALLFDVAFKRLGVCVIDEQHKFGVNQRISLRQGGIDPHYLVMSATPIPRSIAMTQFGDVDMSVLRDKPAGRGTVHTYLADEAWRARWWSFVRERLEEGRQAFVVAPRVGDKDESADDEDISSVKHTFESLSNGELAKYQVGLLHGRMHADEKHNVMSQFAEGEIDVLVTTTVIEVGIDVPNATVMTILGANRFGLAQLHQLRGRVSRGSHAGHVAVFIDGDASPKQDERLRTFESTHDGFELAEADFKLRGPGELLGQRQSGLPRLRIADLQNDVRVLEIAREVAQTLIDEDPEISDPSLALLRRQVLSRYGKRLELSDGA